MLGFVPLPEFTSPANQEEYRDAVDDGIREGHERIDGVSQAGILHVYQCELPGSEIMSSGKGDCTPLVGRDDVVGLMLSDIRVEVSEQRIRTPV